MKKATNYIRAVQALGKIFDAANEEYCNGQLEKPTITIQSSKTALAHISVSKVWKNSEGQATRELNLSAEYLMTEERNLENVCCSVLHEMAHAYNMDILKRQDVSKNGYYHNKYFKQTAEEVFKLKIDCHPQYGWTVTTPTYETLELIEKYGLQPILINRDGGQTSQPTGTATTGTTLTKITGKKKQNSIKWTCGCGCIIRSTSEIEAKCCKCGTMFERA